MKKISCGICNAKMDEMHYAIRDMKATESYGEWLLRHIACLLTFGQKSRKHAIIIPVCGNCTNTRLSYNIAGVSERVA